jgi:uncharacterized protein (DUF1778 family)
MDMAPKTRHLRVSPADDELLRRAAAAAGESLSEFLVTSGRERAELILADRTAFVLDDEAWTRLAAALDRPAELKPVVAQLMRRPRPE